MKKITQLSLLAVLALTSCKKDKAETDNQTHGIALQYMDTTVTPGDDFYSFVNGKWFDKTEIPADKSTWGSFDELAKNTDLDVLNMLKEAANNKDLKSSSDE